ncbi:MAG: DUF3644 domain-containing protein [Paracoccus hibiscisoli]|uniref:DUF3644 domain-containing protein n=1 Tax=Paracoccus hibiscisoli TaxID=2023261 RepID=UPI00391A79F8
MLFRGGEFSVDQDVLAYFSRPTRSINHRLIGQIRKGQVGGSVDPASAAELDRYLASWPDLDPATGLGVRSDELLIKAREAMIAAVQNFNAAGMTFRGEMFLVTAVIAWTYLLHAWFRREGVDYRHKDKQTPQGADRYWGLGKCLKHPRSPVKGGAKKNLEFLIDIRHEVEHRMTNRIDDAIGAKLQACALNFNDILKKEFGAGLGLEKRLPLALQFTTFGRDQRALLKAAAGLPPNVEAAIHAFEHGLTEEEIRDPAYRISYGFVPMVGKKAGAADMAVQIVPPGSPEAADIEKIILKEVNRERYPPSKVVTKVRAAGFEKFTIHNHTKLWQARDAKNPAKGYGCMGDYGSWVYFDRWIDEVVDYCAAAGDRFRKKSKLA